MEVETGGYESPTPWDDPTWRQDALDWIGDELAAAGTPPVDLDAIVVRARPWSVVIRIPVTTGDDVWFKANPPSSAFEPALMAALAAWTPAHVLRPIAVDCANPGRSCRTVVRCCRHRRPRPGWNPSSSTQNCSWPRADRIS